MHSVFSPTPHSSSLLFPHCLFNRMLALLWGTPSHLSKTWKQLTTRTHRGWNDMLQSLFEVRIRDHALREQSKPQSCVYLNQIIAFSLLTKRMSLFLSGSSPGIHKSWQYNVLRGSQEGLAHPGATEVAWFARTQKQLFCIHEDTRGMRRT